MEINLNNQKSTGIILARKGFIKIATIEIIKGNIESLCLNFNFENSYNFSDNTKSLQLSTLIKKNIGVNTYSLVFDNNGENDFPKIVSDNPGNKSIYIFCSSTDKEFDFNVYYD
ncbi:MAG: hypothetical protein ABIP51_15540 [Bacteroidia bacterium]